MSQIQDTDSFVCHPVASSAYSTWTSTEMWQPLSIEIWWLSTSNWYWDNIIIFFTVFRLSFYFQADRQLASFIWLRLHAMYVIRSRSFSRRAAASHRWVRSFFKFLFSKVNFLLDCQTRQAKSSSQPVNLHGTWPLIKLLP